MKVEIYTKDQCAYCNQAKQFFANKGWEYTEHYITIENREDMLKEMELRLGFMPRTVPQIFIDDQAIGGYNELISWSNKQ